MGVLVQIRLRESAWLMIGVHMTFQHWTELYRCGSVLPGRALQLAGKRQMLP